MKNLEDLSRPRYLLHAYAPNETAFLIMYLHGQAVAKKALHIAESSTNYNKNFIYEASLLHDIGVYETDSPEFQCFGEAPYIQHGILGARILRQLNLPRHARVAERHTGVGISKQDIEQGNLPLPPGEYIPTTKEEKVIAYSDKFFSKKIPTPRQLQRERTIREIVEQLQRFGDEKVALFMNWHKEFSRK